MSNDDFNEYFDDEELGIQSNGNGTEAPDKDEPYTISPTDAMMALAGAIENLTETLHRMFPQSAPSVPVESEKPAETEKPAGAEVVTVTE